MGIVISVESRSEVLELIQAALDSLNDALEILDAGSGMNRSEILRARNELWALLQGERARGMGPRAGGLAVDPSLDAL